MFLKTVFFILASVLSSYAQDSAVQELAKGNEKFTSGSYQELAKSQEGNLIVSPFSAQTVLGLTSQGAEGQTEQELVRSVGLPSSAQRRRVAFRAVLTSLNKSSDSLKVLTANKIYLAQNLVINKSFQKTAVDYYNADAQNVNFAQNVKAANTINSWVESRTNNKIQNLIKPNQLSGNTRVVLVNALYFSGKWVTPFPKEQTRKGTFYTSSTDSEQIDFMHSRDSAIYKYFHCGYLQAKFLELPIRDSNISVTVVLPIARDGLKKLEENLEDVLKPHNLTYQRVAVSLPKFTITTNINFKPILENLGVERLFSPNEANLTGIAEGENLFVDFVVQKAFINVTESGVEAAAATAVGGTRVILPSPTTFEADHPFFYFIKDSQTEVILFTGRFNNK